MNKPFYRWMLLGLIFVPLALLSQIGNPPPPPGIQRFVSNFPGANAEARIVAAVASLPTNYGGTVFVDLTGNQSWPATLTATPNVNYIFTQCATFDATSLTSAPILTSVPGGSWRFVGAGTGNGSALNGCTIFTVANTSAQNFNLVDQSNVELGGFSVLRSAGSGGDIIDAAYVQSSNLHDIHADSITSGAKWVDGYHFNEDANGSSIYNIVTNVAVYVFNATTCSVSANAFHLTGGTGGKVLNQNDFKQLLGGGCGSTGGTTGLLVDGTQVNENHINGDFSYNLTDVSVAANATRNLVISDSTMEGLAGTTGLSIGSGNIYTSCRNCEIVGNGTANVVDSSANNTTYITGNIGGVLQGFGVSAAGDMEVNSIGLGGANPPGGAGGEINGPTGWTLAGSGVNALQITSAGPVAMRHLLVSGPSLSSTNLSGCGTSPALVGTDNFGTITVGSAAGTGCVLTFGTAWGTAPSCVVSDDSAIVAIQPVSTTTTLTLTGSAALTGAKLTYACGSIS